MRRSRLAAALTVLPLAISSLAFDQSGQVCRTIDPDPAATGDEYDLCEVTGYVTGQTTKVGNASYLQGSPQAVASWDETAPTTSFAAGGGTGYLTSSVPNSATGLAKAVYQGTFSGELEAIDFDLYLLFRPDAVFQPDDINIQVEARAVDADGNGDGPWMTLLGMSDQFDVDVEYLGGSTQILWRQDFGLTGFRRALEFVELDGDIERELRITVQSHFSDSGNWIYVHDATEVPSALTFNPDDQLFDLVTPKLSIS